MTNRARSSIAADLAVAPVTSVHDRAYTLLHQTLSERHSGLARPLLGEPQLARAYRVAGITVHLARQQLEATQLVVRRPEAAAFPVSAEAPRRRGHRDTGRWLEAVVLIDDGTHLRDFSCGEVRATR